MTCVSFRRSVMYAVAVRVVRTFNLIKIIFVFSVTFGGKTNPSTAYVVPLPLGKGGIKNPARQKQKHTVRAFCKAPLKPRLVTEFTGRNIGH